jgi:spore coat protein H
VEIAAPEWERLRQDNRHYVRATFHDGETVIRDVGVHLKGAAGSFRGQDDHPALSVSFDRFVPDQRWEGLPKVHLNNSVQDGSYLTENICGELFRQSGVPAARACNVRVTLNKRDLGIYVLKEGFDKTFLRQYYHNAKGNLYDGGFCHDITEKLDKMSGDASRDQPEIKALVAAAEEGDLKRRFQKLDELLDMDRFLSFCAMEVMTWDWDGYVLKPNNYRLYRDPDSKKIAFFPHGMDQMFWEPTGPLRPGMNGLVARALVETPEGRRRYRERMTELTTNVFRLEAITNRIAAYAAPIRAALGEKDPNAAREYDGQVQRIRDLVTAREAFLRKELLGSRPKP